MKSLKTWFPAIALLIFAAGCAGSGPAADDGAAKGPDIRGTITRIAGATLVVEENPSEQSGSPKAAVEITGSTRIRTSAGGPMSPYAFRTGQIVSVWFKGPVLESYPVRATAEQIIVDR